MKTKFFILTFFSFAVVQQLTAQVKFSLATDASILRNFDGKQPFTVFGQSIRAQWHMDEKITLFAFFSYHGNGKYSSTLRADAKSPTTTPQTINFTNKSEMRLRNLSLGLRRYVIGNFRKDVGFNAYGELGFGLLLGKATNTFSAAIDTSLYSVQDSIINGSGKFKRLSLDLALGFEIPVVYEIFFFSEARVHIPTSDYPSNYLLKNNRAPFLGTFSVGLRILFDSDD